MIEMTLESFMGITSMVQGFMEDNNIDITKEDISNYKIQINEQKEDGSIQISFGKQI